MALFPVVTCWPLTSSFSATGNESSGNTIPNLVTKTVSSLTPLIIMVARWHKNTKPIELSRGGMLFQGAVKGHDQAWVVWKLDSVVCFVNTSYPLDSDLSGG